MDCTSGIERFVWAGDNILWEMRSPGGDTEPLERLELEPTNGVEYGIVGYTHAGGVDRLLVAYKTLGGNAGAVVVPHMNWRGLFSLGTNPSGGASTTPVEWPGFRTTANHSMGETQGITKNWMGSLLEGQRDAGGLMYMRNRYYDPQTGQFTQTDPIGIAGGLNTYGFAAGDPVTYADPYGLCPGIPDTNQLDPTDCPPGYFTLIGTVMGGAGGALVGGAAGLVCLETGPGVIVCVAAGAAGGAKAGAAAGAFVGSAIDVGMGLLRMARAGRGGGNSAENRGSNYFIQKHNLNRAGQQELHRRLGRAKNAGEEITDETLDDLAADVASHSKWVREP